MSRVVESRKRLVATASVAVVAGLLLLVMAREQAPDRRSGPGGETQNAVPGDRVIPGETSTAPSSRSDLGSEDSREGSPQLSRRKGSAASQTTSSAQSTTGGSRSEEASTLVLQPPWELIERRGECDSSGCKSLLQIDPLTGKMRLALEVESGPSSPRAIGHATYATFRTYHHLTRPVEEVNYEFHVDLGPASATRWGTASARGYSVIQACRGCFGDAASDTVDVVQSAGDGQEVLAQSGLFIYRLRFWMPDGNGKKHAISPGDLRLNFTLFANAASGTYAYSPPVGGGSAPSPGRAQLDLTFQLFKVVVIL
jgi:hypothetical protein